MSSNETQTNRKFHLIQMIVGWPKMTRFQDLSLQALLVDTNIAMTTRLNQVHSLWQKNKRNVRLVGFPVRAWKCLILMSDPSQTANGIHVRAKHSYRR